jgi:uncharacterized membrane protein
MPYCCHCGNKIEDMDAYCPRCGAAQHVRTLDIGEGLSPRTASILCYIPFAGWIAAIVVLASHKFRHDRRVRFHAFQGLYLFVAWLLVDWVVHPFFRTFPGPHIPINELLQLALLVVWIFMLVKTSQDEQVSLPILGELAEKSLSES